MVEIPAKDHDTACKGINNGPSHYKIFNLCFWAVYPFGLAEIRKLVEYYACSKIFYHPLL